jgi:hypothetical protein
MPDNFTLQGAGESCEPLMSFSCVTYGGPQVSRRKKNSHGKIKLTHGKMKLTHGKIKLTHGKIELTK